jgi:septal ring factor EnvC (AmiA/AmiB activator)
MPNPLASAAGADPPASSRHQLVGHGRPPAQGTSAALSSPSPHSQPSDPLERSRKLAAFRAKQQEEYAKSLAADRERARKKREEEQALAAALRLKAQADADAMQAAEREAAQEREVEKAEAKEESEEDEEEEPDDPRFRKERHLAFLNRFAKPE